MTDSYSKLVKLLRQLFQLDRPELSERHARIVFAVRTRCPKVPGRDTVKSSLRSHQKASLMNCID